MHKYNVGDIVQVRNDLKSSEVYGGIAFIERMNCTKGQNITITKACYKRSGYANKEVGCYETSSDYLFTDEMIEGKSNSRDIYMGGCR